MTEAAHQIPILMFHSISNGDGPTCITPEIFRAQMDMVSEAGWQVVSLDAVLDWHKGGTALPEKAMAITFDDGFADFIENAHPVLEEKGFANTMFVPTRNDGGAEHWIGAASPPRPLMTHSHLREIDQTQTMIAPHSRTHADLTLLSAEERAGEISGAKADFEDLLGRDMPHFAAPYGRVNEAVQRDIRAQFDLAVGVTHGIAKAGDDLIDLPRIEMFYYQDLPRWQAFLEGRGGAYLASRQLIRRIRKFVRGLTPNKAGY